MTRAGIYARISNDPHETEAGVTRQERDCRELCEKNGWDVAEVYVDNDVSAGQPMSKRPAFTAMLSDAEAERFDVIVAWRDDRLWRDVDHQRTVFRLCSQVGVTSVVAGGQTYDPSSIDDKFTAGIRAQVAEYEAAQTALRVRRALRDKAERGHFPTGGYRRFGYTRDGEVIEEERKLVLEGAERILDRGDSPGQVVRDWNARNEPTATHNPATCGKDGHKECTSWSRTSFRRVMCSHTLAGLRIHQGEVVAEGQWEAILTPEQRDRLERRLTNTDVKAGGPAKYLLMGFAREWQPILYCGRDDCGAALRSNFTRGYRKYVCKDDDGAGRGCNRISVSADRAEEEVRERIAEVLNSDAFTKALAERYAQDDDGERAELVDELDALETRRSQLVNDLANPDVDREATQMALSAVQVRKRELEESLAQLEDNDDVSRLVSGIDQLRELWDSDELDAQRTVIRALLKRIEIHPSSTRGRKFDRERVKTVWRV